MKKNPVNRRCASRFDTLQLVSNFVMPLDLVVEAGQKIMQRNILDFPHNTLEFAFFIPVFPVFRHAVPVRRAAAQRYFLV